MACSKLHLSLSFQFTSVFTSSQKFTVHVMALLEPANLDNLQGVNRVRFPMEETDDDVAVYWGVIDGIIMACCGLEKVNKNPDISEIPSTKCDADPAVFVIHVIGTYKNVACDHLLLIEKVSVYLLAAKLKEGWHQVKNSKKPIKDAKTYGFQGSYTELPGGGLQKSKKLLKLGLLALKEAIIKIVLGKCTGIDFLTVALNLCEAARYPYIAGLVAGDIPKSLRPVIDERCKFLMSGWEDFSTAVKTYNSKKRWVFDGKVKGDEEGVVFVTLETAPKIIAMLKET